jgi:gas vesicle protein
MAQSKSTSEDLNNPEAEHAQGRSQGGQRTRRVATPRGDGDGDDGQRFAGGNAAGNFAATTLRSIGQLYDLQAASARILFRSQFRAAAAFGLPDYSRLFAVADDRTLRLFSAATDNAVRFADQLEETRAEIQSHVSRLLEQQTIDFTERWHYGLEELQQQASESLQQFKALSRQQAEEMARASESLSEATRATLREGGEQLRATVRHGMEQGRDIAERHFDAINDAGERVNESVRESVRSGRRGNGGDEGALHEERRGARASRSA